MVITDSHQLTAAWVDAALRRAGALRDGAVAAIDVIDAPLQVWSRSLHIRVRYRDGATGECPTRLLLKSSGGDGSAMGIGTLHYFNRDYAGLPASPLPRCYDSVHEAWPRRYHLLVQDAAYDHRPCDEGEPNLAHGLALADALASLHAHLWGAARLQAGGVALPDHTDFELYAIQVGAGLEPLIAAAPPELDADCARRLRGVFPRLAARFAARAADRIGLTQLHGDLNPAHLLRPNDAAGPLLLAERQPPEGALTRWLGASDLVNAMLPWWDVETRRELEMPVLRRYHAALREREIEDYSFARLIEDYRFCIVEAIALAMRWCVHEDDCERLRWLWRRQLRRGLAAYQDHDCAGIWE